MTDRELELMIGLHPKLRELTLRGRFRHKVAAVLRDLEAMGLEPRLFECLRSEERQRQLIARGVSRTMASYHLPGRDGLARAADIVQDDRDPWSTEHPGDQEFWLTVARLATTKGLNSGATWIDKFVRGQRVPDASARAKLLAFLLDGSRPWQPETWKGKVGWDLPHVQTVGVAK